MVQACASLSTAAHTAAMSSKPAIMAVGLSSSASTAAASGEHVKDSVAASYVT